MLGPDGMLLESQYVLSITSLEYFSKINPHARQYLNTMNALFNITTTYALEQEMRVRKQRKRASAALFGLFPGDNEEARQMGHNTAHEDDDVSTAPSQAAAVTLDPPPVNDTEWTTGDEDVFALPWLQGNDLDLQSFLQPDRDGIDGSFAGVSLFPIFDQGTPGLGRTQPDMV
jgi:hypothetical protein